MHPPLHIFETYSPAFIPLAVLMASFLGSWHCVAMCGGLITVAAPTTRSAWFYHLGRLLGYASLGAIAGWLGEKTLFSSLSGILPWISAFVLGSGFILMGIFSWSGPPRVKIPAAFLNFYSRLWRGMLSQDRENLFRSSTVGLLSVFLPCGWFYSFVLAAMATQSPVYGSLLLFTFWLGSLPALSLAPILVQKFLTPFAQRAPKIAAVLLMMIGLWTIAIKVSTLIYQSKGNSFTVICPGHTATNGEKSTKHMHQKEPKHGEQH